jgi:hypothetical protein
MGLHLVDMRLDVGLSVDENRFTLPCKERRVQSARELSTIYSRLGYGGKAQ